MSHKVRTVVSVFACFHGKSRPFTGIKMNCNFFLDFASCWLKDQTIALQAQDKSTGFLFSWPLVGLAAPGAPANPEGRAQPIRYRLDWVFSGFMFLSSFTLWFYHQNKRVIRGSQQKSCSFWEKNIKGRLSDNLGKGLCGNQDKPKQNSCLNQWKFKLNCNWTVLRLISNASLRANWPLEPSGCWL